MTMITRPFLSLRNYLLFLLLSTQTFSINGSAAGQETLVGIAGSDFIILGADSSSSSGSVALTSSNLDKIFVLTDPFPSEPPPADESHRRQHSIVAATAGDAADADRLLGILAAHAAIREFEVGVGCDVECVFGSEDGAMEGVDASSIAHLARGEISTSLRSGRPLQVCMLVAGMVRCDDSIVTTDDDGGTPHHESSSRIQQQIESGVGEFLKSNSVFGVVPNSRSRHIRSPKASQKYEPRLFWLDETGALQKLPYGAHGLAANFAWSILDQGYREDITREEASDLIRDCFEQLRTRYVINSPMPPCIKCIDVNGCRLVT